MLEASSRELRKGFFRNAKAASALQGSHEFSRGMLVFYAVECGLKSIIMTDRGHKTSSSVAEYGHNIRKLIREGGLSASELAFDPTVDAEWPKLIQATNGGQISFTDIHTAWRYAIDLKDTGDEEAINLLDRILSALRKRLTA